MAKKGFSRVIHTQQLDEATATLLNSNMESNQAVLSNVEEMNSNIGRLVKVLENTMSRTIGKVDTSSEIPKMVDHRETQQKGLLSSIYEWGEETFSTRNVLGVQEGTGSLSDRILSYFEHMNDKNSGLDISSEQETEQGREQSLLRNAIGSQSTVLDEILKEITGLRKDIREDIALLTKLAGIDAAGDFLGNRGVDIDIDPKRGIFKKTFDAVKSVIGTLFSVAIIKTLGTAVIGALVGAGLISATLKLFEDYQKGRKESDEFIGLLNLQKQAESGEGRKLTQEETTKLEEYKDRESMGQGPYNPEVKRTVPKSTIDKETAEATLQALSSSNPEDVQWGKENLKEFGVSEEGLRAFYEAQYGKNATAESRAATPTLSAAERKSTGEFQDFVQPEAVKPEEVKPEAVKPEPIKIPEPEKEEGFFSGMLGKIKGFFGSDEEKSTEPEPQTNVLESRNFTFSEEQLQKTDPEKWKEFNEFRNTREAEIRKSLEDQIDPSMGNRDKMRAHAKIKKQAEDQARIEAIKKFSPESETTKEAVPVTTVPAISPSGSERKQVGDNIHKISSETDALKQQKASAPVVVSAPSTNNVSSTKSVIPPSAPTKDNDSTIRRYHEKQYGF